MNRIILLTITTLILTGCGSSGSDEDLNAVPSWCLIQYSTDTAQTFDSGLVLEPSSQMYVPPEEVKWLWQQAKNCMNVPDTVAPTVAYKSFGADDSLITGAMGQYKMIPGLVLINTDNPGSRRNCKTDAATLSHEFVHHILFISTGDPFPDTGDLRSTPNHGSLLFGPPSNGGCVPSSF